MPSAEDNLNQLQILEIKEAFAVLDKDGDGCITTKDLETIIRSLGFKPTEDELKKMVQEVDTDGNGIIDFDEFFSMVARQMGNRDPEQQIRDTFRLLDETNSGEIPVEKMRQVLASQDSRLTYEDIEGMILEVDSDGNGVIDFQEFKKMMTSI